MTLKLDKNWVAFKEVLVCEGSKCRVILGFFSMRKSQEEILNKIIYKPIEK